MAHSFAILMVGACTLAMNAAAEPMVLNETEAMVPGGAAGVYAVTGVDSPFDYYQQHIVEACHLGAETTLGQWESGSVATHSASCAPPPAYEPGADSQVWIERNGQQGLQSDDARLL